MNIRMKKCIFLIFLICGFITAALLCLPVFQNFLLSLGEKIHGKTLDTNKWTVKMFTFSCELVLVLCFIIFYNLRLVSYSKKNITGKSKIAIPLFLVLVSFITSFQFASFPFISRLPGTDSSVFIYIGQMMHKGFVPYRDMFDHKGLYLYFIEFLGTTARSYSFIYVIELLNLCFAATFLYKTSFLTCGNSLVSVATAVFVLCFTGHSVYYGGNLTESYALSFVAFALYEFLKYLKTEKITPVEILFVGIAFTVVLFLRVNMVAPWAFFVLLIIILSVKKRQFSTLGNMILWFSAGITIAIVPVALYLIKTGSAKVLWESYILFNFKYIAHNASFWRKLIVAFSFLIRFGIVTLLFVVALIKNFRNKIFMANLSALLFTFYFVVISGRNDAHYGMILLPFFTMPTGFVFNALYSFVQKKHNGMHFGEAEKRLFYVSMAVFGFVFLFGLTSLSRNSKAAGAENDVIQYLKNNTLESNDVLVLGNSVVYNVASNRFSKQRFFYQRPIFQINVDFLAEFKESVFSQKPDYIVYPPKEETFTKDAIIEVYEELTVDYEKISFNDGVIFKKR